MSEQTSKVQKKRKCFIINLSEEEPASKIVSTEVSSNLLSQLMSPQDRVKELEKKLHRYKRRRLRPNSSSSALQSTVEQLESKVKQLEEERRVIHSSFSEQLSSKEKKINELLNNNSHGLLTLNLENLQEKLFAKSEAISQMNLKVSRLEADKAKLSEELQKTKVELCSLKDSHNNND